MGIYKLKRLSIKVIIISKMMYRVVIVIALVSNTFGSFIAGECPYYKTYYEGEHFVEYHNIRSWEDCGRACFEEERCNYWLHDNYYYSCALKSEITNQFPYDGYTSGDKD